MSALGPPDRTLDAPRGVPLLLSGFFERLAFFALRASLTIYAGTAIFGGERDPASALYASFLVMVHLATVAGAYVGDAHVGRGRLATIGLLTCLGGILLICIPDRAAFQIGLAAVAVGTGFYRPNLTASFSDAYANNSRRESMFLLLYVAMVLAAMLGPLSLALLGVRVSSSAYVAPFLVATAAIVASVGCLHLAGLRAGAPAPGTNHSLPMTRVALLVATATGIAAALMSVGPGSLPIILLLLVVAVVVVLATGTSRDAAMPRGNALLFLGLLGMQALYWAGTEHAAPFVGFLSTQLLDDAASDGMAGKRAGLLIAPLSVVVYALLGAWFLRRGATTARSIAIVATGLALTAAGHALLAAGAHLRDTPLLAAVLVIVSQTIATLGEVCFAPIALALMTRLAPARWTSLSVACWFALPPTGRWLVGQFPGSRDSVPDVAQTTVTIAFLAFSALVLVWLAIARAASAADRGP